MQAVLLAGGEGTRLRPLTHSVPKPLLPMGPCTVLGIALRCLQHAGVQKAFVAARYRADFVAAFLGDGSRYGLLAEVSVEKEPLGTCGPLALLRERLTEPFILMNGDVLTDLDFAALYRHAVAAVAPMTAVTTNVEIQVPYGEVVVDGHHVTRVREKPSLRVEVLAGIYVMRPEVLPLIPDGQAMGIDELMAKMLSIGLRVERYPTRAYWRDIGQVDSYEQANREFPSVFGHLMGGSRGALTVA